MKAPNGEKTNLTENQWTAMRTEPFKRQTWGLGINKQRKKVSESQPVSVLTGKEFEKSDVSQIDHVKNFFEGIRVEGIGIVVLNRSSVKDSISHGFGKRKDAAFKAISEIIAQGEIVDRQKNWKGRGYTSYTVSGSITISRERFVAFAIVNQSTDKTTIGSICTKQPYKKVYRVRSSRPGWIPAPREETL